MNLTFLNAFGTSYFKYHILDICINNKSCLDQCHARLLFGCSLGLPCHIQICHRAEEVKSCHGQSVGENFAVIGH